MEIPLWARACFTQLAKNAVATRPLLYAGSSHEPKKIQSLILMNLGKALSLAGLASDPTVTPLSIRNTAGRRAYESGGIEAAANLLGLEDFNSVAREIGLRPHLPTRKK